MQPSNKTILERSIDRPAMMAFVLTGIYLTTGQLIPGVVWMKNQTTESPRVEEGKVIAERLNGSQHLLDAGLNRRISNNRSNHSRFV